MNWLALAIALPWLGALLGCYIGYQILLQRRRILDRLDNIEDDLRDELAVDGPPELKMGAKLPAFELPDLEGKPVSLRDFLGRRVLMIFIGPQCKFSRQLIPGLAPLPLDGREGRAELLLISTGEVEENRELVKEFGLRCKVMLQEGWSVASGVYGINGSPMGYVLDEEGAIASRLTMGHPDLLALAKAEISAPRGGGGAGNAAPSRKRRRAASKAA